MTQPTTVAADPAQRSPAVDDLIRGMHAERERNRAFFEAHCDDLFAEHSEDWLLIHSGGEVIASDNLFELAGRREALDTVPRGGALIKGRPRRLADKRKPNAGGSESLDSLPKPRLVRSGPLSDRARASAEEHQRNLDFFLAHQEELFAKYPKMWLLIHSGGEVVASKDLFELNDLRETFDSVTRSAALFEIKRPWPMIPTLFFVR